MSSGRVSFEGFCAAAKRQSESRIHEVARRGGMLTGAMLTALQSCAEYVGVPNSGIGSIRWTAKGRIGEGWQRMGFEHRLRLVDEGMKGGKSGHY